LFFFFDNWEEYSMVKNPHESIWYYKLQKKISGAHQYKLIVESNEHSKPVETYDSNCSQKIKVKEGNTICIFTFP